MSCIFHAKKAGRATHFPFYFIAILIAFVSVPFNTKATHISGANLTYRWINGNTYEINLTLYRDCSGIAAPNSVSITYNSISCGYNLNVMLNRLPVTGEEITRPCDSTSSICNGGTNPGVQKYEYTGIVTLPANCNDWIFEYTICCRNCAITTLSYVPNNCAGVPGTYVEATLDNLNAPGNSSPVFTNNPLYFYCIGQPMHYNLGVVDMDGDSLVYSLINPRSSSTNDVNFNAGYSATNPITSVPALALSSSGNISVNPVSPEVGVMAILVKEYRNGVLIGSIVQDVEMWVEACTNNLPVVSGVNGTTNYDIIACPNNNITFTLNSSDADAGQIVFMTWNNGISGASFSVTTDSIPVGTFSWTPTAANARSQPYTFTVTVQDNDCPNNGFQIYSYNVFVPSVSVSINSTNSSCANPGNGTATAIPIGTGPFQYFWNPGAETTSSISGLVAGTYTVTMTDANGCTSSASTTITSAFSLNIAALSVNNPGCSDTGDGSISVLVSGGSAPYAYSWSAPGGTNPTLTNLYSGIYTVTVTDNYNCTASMGFTLSQPPVLNAFVSSTDLLCNGVSTGSASVTATGGTGAYTYQWSNTNTTSSIAGIPAGNYTVVVTDVNGCSQTRSVTINEPPPVTISVSKTNATCGTSNGSIVTSTTGGIGSYSYNWTPGNISTPSLSNLDAGLYILDVTDLNGCIQSVSVGISNTTGPTLMLSSYSNVSCFGANDGSATVSVSGQGPFTCSWSPTGGSATSTSGLAPGSYTFTATDVNNCTSNLTIIISEPPPLTTSFATINPTCSNSNNGSAAVIVSGGTPGYFYLWSPSNANTQVLNNIPVGDYPVRVTDASGCFALDTLHLWQPLPLVTTSSITTPASCNGGSNGTGQIFVAGGQAPYRYAWFPSGDTMSFASGLSAGTYQVTVTDVQNCTRVFPLTITQPTAVNTSLTSTRSIICLGGSDGNVRASASGGLAPYTYSWAHSGQTDSLITNLAAGIYTVTSTDASGCTTSSAFLITEATALNVSTQFVTPVSCFWSMNGSASAVVSGGVGPYTFIWNPSGGTNSVASNLAPGNYTVRVTDAIGCTNTSNATITQPLTLATSVSTSDASCFGANDGSATVTASGGTAPYSYSWAPSGGNAATASGLISGNYTVTITDSRSCTTTASVLINEPPEIVLTLSTATSTCGGAVGSSQVSATGGIPGYSYLWGPVFSTDSILLNIPVGTYSVTVQDASGCTTSGSTNVINTTSPIITSTITPVSCNGGNNGAAALTLTGGFPPFTFQWSPVGGTGASAIGLTSGFYTVSVTDSFDCITYYSLTIPQPFPLSLNMSSVSVACFGGSNGVASVSVTGGNTPYTYLWNNANTTSSNTGLATGNYSVTVTDQKGCTIGSTVNVGQAPALTSSVNNQTPVSCFGGNDGTASVLANGGTPPYQYSWNPSGINALNASGLAAGNYLVTVTDQAGCTTTSGAIITQPTALTTQTSSVSGSCNISNGSAQVVASGGSAPYTYIWSHTPQTSPTINNLFSGTYYVEVRDINSCIVNDSVVVSNTGVIAASLASSTNVSCKGGNDGTAQINVSGGNPPYSYSWNPAVGNSFIANGLTAGNYVATVTDASSCSQSISLSIIEPPILSIPVTVHHIRCFGQTNGLAIVNASGGMGVYGYNWQPGGMTSPIIGSLNAGTYTVVVNDGNGCTATAQATIIEPSLLSVTASSTLAGCDLSNGSATAFALGGTNPLRYVWNPGGALTNVAANQPAGSYSVSISDSNNCAVSATVSISNTIGPNLTMVSTTDVSCFGGNNGVATVLASGGATPYQFNWFPYGGHATVANNLSANTYSATVRDSNNCLTALNVTINEPPLFVTNVTATPVTCFSFSDGKLTAVSSGGSPPYHFLWSTSDTISALTNLFAGNYFLNATDSLGCNTLINSTVSTPPPIGLDLQVHDVSCFGGNDGFATVTVSGGTPGYSYLWSNGSISSSSILLTAGTYQLTVTDANGCTADTSFIIQEPPLLVLSSTIQDVTCKGSADGQASITTAGGVSPYTYNWSPNGSTADNAINLKEGNYIVTVTDAHFCTQTIPLHIGSPLQLSISATAKDVSCFGENDGNAIATVGGGIPPYSYFWTNGSDSSRAASLIHGTYSIIITDANLCTITSSVVVNQPEKLKLETTNPPTICIGEQVNLSVQTTGGTPSYSYSWNNGNTTNPITVSPEVTTIYYVQVTDSNGCVSNPAVARVVVNPPLNSLTTNPDTLCRGDNALLIALVYGGDGGPYTYHWNTEEKSDRITVSPPSTTLYNVTVSDKCGTPPVSINIPVIVNQLPEVDFSPATISGCQPLLVNFSDQTNSIISTYYWNFGDGGFDTSKEPTHIYLDAGSYSINHIVTDIHGCIGKKVIAGAVKVFPFPAANFVSSPEVASIFTPQINFVDQSSNATKWEWNFGDNSDYSLNQNPLHTYNDTGTYSIRLVTTSENGCVDTTYGKISIKGEFAIYIPNAFTPNGDGVNDFFSPLGIGVKDFEMFIYDRWGSKIFGTEDILKGWNGRTMDGDILCQMDVYVYIIKTVDLSGNPHEYVGHISLVR